MATLKYEVNSTLSEDGKLVIETDSLFGDVRERMYRHVVDLQDDAVKQALIKLGWTPPDERISNDISDA